jgi:hypothetical protein
MTDPYQLISLLAALISLDIPFNALSCSVLVSINFLLTVPSLLSSIPDPILHMFLLNTWYLVHSYPTQEHRYPYKKIQCLAPCFPQPDFGLEQEHERKMKQKGDKKRREKRIVKRVKWMRRGLGIGGRNENRREKGWIGGREKME